MIEVTLCEHECKLAVAEGQYRRFLAIERHLHWQNGKDERSEERDSEAAASEITVAKAFDRYPYSYFQGNPGGVDVSKDIEVKWTPRSNGCLLVKSKEISNPKHRYILVTGTMPNFILRGWAYGYEAQLDEWWRPEAQAYFFPQDRLHELRRR